MLAYGAGGASLILALAADQSLRDRVHKLAFLECDDAIAKALSLTSKQAEERGGTMWSTSPVVTVLDRRAIAFKQDKEPVGSVIKQGKESHCACPIVSVRFHVQHVNPSPATESPKTNFVCFQDRSCGERRNNFGRRSFGTGLFPQENPPEPTSLPRHGYRLHGLHHVHPCSGTHSLIARLESICPRGTIPKTFANKDSLFLSPSLRDPCWDGPSSSLSRL